MAPARSIATLARRLLLALPLLAAFGAAPAAAQPFVFHLRGDQEVPPSSSTASGGCHGLLNSGAGTFTLTCVHDVVGATMIHIHRAPPGSTGPVVFDLGDPVSPVQATWTGMTPADVADLLAGNLYINIHTDGRPAGEIRGQILADTVGTVIFGLAAGQVVPPEPAGATGSCVADLDAAATSLDVQCTHDLPSPDEAHLHEGRFGENGPIAFNFPSAASPFGGAVPMTPLLVAELAATFLYVEVHDLGSGGGEAGGGATIRGQVGTPPAPPSTGTVRITKRTSPAGAGGFGFTTDLGGPFTLADGGTQTFAAVPAGTHQVTEGEPGTSPGGYSLSGVDCDDVDSVGDPFARTATVSVTPGELVTCTFTNVASLAGGELFVFHLEGAQEVPPVASAASGGCAARLDAAAGSLSIVCTHDVAGATVMHIHRAPAGANGPVAFDLGDPTSPVVATWTGMTPADVADLRAGNLYVNIHDAGRPAGVIRGQMLPRTVDTRLATLQGSEEVPPVSSPAGGSCVADLSDSGDLLDVRCVHGVSNPTMAHLHSAPRGENGPVAFTFPSAASPFAADVPTTLRLLADFAAGFLYVNVHSDEFPQGEVRGQLSGLDPGLAAIPTVGEWGLLLLVLALAGAGVRRLLG